MANKLHGALTDTDGLHEPKGLEIVTDTTSVYVSDGTGGGAWTTRSDYVSPSYICVYLDQGEITDRTFTQTDTILPFTLDYLTSSASNFTYDNVAKDLTYTGTATINVHIVTSITLSKGVTGSDVNLKFYLEKDINDGNGFITQMRTMAGDTLEDNSLSNICVTCVGELSTGDKLRMAVSSSDAVVVTAENINMTVTGITV